MNRTSLAVLILPVLLTTGILAKAQEENQPFEKKSGMGSYELNVGSGWSRPSVLLPGGGRQFDIGIAGIHYLGRKRVMHRISYRWELGYVLAGTSTYFDQNLGSDARVRKQQLMLNESMGFDLVQTSHLDLTVRYGGAIIDNLTSFYLKDSSEPSFTGYKNVCSLDAFRSRCSAHLSVLGNEGVGLRVYPRRHSPIYFGVTYTRFALGGNRLVGTIGGSF
jgi:hypothetical protein